MDWMSMLTVFTAARLIKVKMRRPTEEGSALGSWRCHGRCGPHSSVGSSVAGHSWTWQSRTWRPGESCLWWEQDAPFHCSSDPPYKKKRDCVRFHILNLYMENITFWTNTI